MYQHIKFFLLLYHTLHSIGNGIYGEIDGSVELNEENIQLVKQEMQRLVAAALLSNFANFPGFSLSGVSKRKPFS